MIKIRILATILSIVLTQPLMAELNVATPDKYPYADPAGARENYIYSGEVINETRLYDFYQRQADYYMANPGKLPKVIPSFPGLDAGLHGHWGKHNQNGHKDGRWMVMGQTQFVGQQMEALARDAISVRVDEELQLSAVFSARTNLSFFRYWSKGFVAFTPGRWGMTGGARPKGKIDFSFSKGSIDAVARNINKKPLGIGWQVAKEKQNYLGFYDTDEAVIFSYEVDNQPVLDTVKAAGPNVFCRTLEFKKGISEAEVGLFDCSDAPLKALENGAVTGTSPKNKAWSALVQGSLGASLKIKDKVLTLQLANIKPGTVIHCYFSQSATPITSPKAPLASLSALIGKRESRWTKTYTTEGVRGKDKHAYAVDDIPVPLVNDNKSLMFFTDLTFDKKGTAYLTTLMGELWKVTGLGSDLKKVTWKKMAMGLNQPFGIKIWDGKIHVLERSQITVLEDLNGDGEIDFFRCFSNEFDDSVVKGSHSHTFGLDRDNEGNIYFVAAWDCIKMSPDGKTSKVVTKGVRNCMGFGKMSDGTILIGPQEGNNTPTSTIIEVREGDNHGFRNHVVEISNPLGYVPRGIDNSTGGYLEVDSARWGPLGRKSLISLCYGYSSWYQILFDKNAAYTGNRQVATVPMHGEFTSGITRGAINPVDGQVYTVGLDGWGDYSMRDGCFARIRYTGKPLLKPIAYEVFDNGIRLSFTQELKKEAVSNIDHYFAQMWDYQNSDQYGSPEFSILNKESLGHDHLPVSSAHLLDDGKSIFVEIPSLQPAMQVHLRMHLETKDGTQFKTDLFPTIVKLGKYHDFPGAKPKQEDKNRKFVLRNTRGQKKDRPAVTRSGEIDAHARMLTVKCVSGLKYNQTKLTVKAGEPLALKLMNTDEMPHNLVIVKPGAMKKVGEASFKMLNDPKALEKNYIPDDRKDVIAFTFVVPPKAQHITYFTAPEEKGEYPFICTFPGHWQIMRGVLIVK